MLLLSFQEKLTELGTKSWARQPRATVLSSDGELTQDTGGRLSGVIHLLGTRERTQEKRGVRGVLLVGGVGSSTFSLGQWSGGHTQPCQPTLIARGSATWGLARGSGVINKTETHSGP